MLSSQSVQSCCGVCLLLGLIAAGPTAQAQAPERVGPHLADFKKGHWRFYWPEGHYLLRYGDCCQQIFESITGHTIFRGTTTVSYPIHDGQGEQCREKAEKWWRDYRKKNPKASSGRVHSAGPPAKMMAAALRNGPGPPNARRAWTAEEDELLRTQPAAATRVRTQ